MQSASDALRSVSDALMRDLEALVNAEQEKRNVAPDDPRLVSLAAEVDQVFAEQEGIAFVTGDGVNKPKGFLAATTVANASWSWGNIGYVASGLAWPAIALLTFLLNARHLLYSAALAPWFRGRSFAERALAALLSLAVTSGRAG